MTWSSLPHHSSTPLSVFTLEIADTEQTMDVSLEDGIPKGYRPMDVGPQTTAALRVRPLRSLECRTLLESCWLSAMAASSFAKPNAVVVLSTCPQSHACFIRAQDGCTSRLLPFQPPRPRLVRAYYLAIRARLPLAPPLSVLARNDRIKPFPDDSFSIHRKPSAALERCSGTGCSAWRSARRFSSGREMSWKPPCRCTTTTSCERPGPRLLSSCAEGERRNDAHRTRSRGACAGRSSGREYGASYVAVDKCVGSLLADSESRKY